MLALASLLLFTAAESGVGAPPPAPVATLCIVMGPGDLRVRGQRGAGVLARATSVSGGDTCGLRWRREGTALRLEAAGDAGCRVDLDVRVAPATTVTVRAADGRVQASGLRADLDVTLARGGAVVGGRCASLRASLGAGSLSATGMFGSAVLSLSSGNAQIWFTEPPRQSFVTLDVGRGNVTVGAPDTEVNSRAQLAEGHARGGGGHGAGRLEITGSIAHGDLIVRDGR